MNPLIIIMILFAGIFAASGAVLLKKGSHNFNISLRLKNIKKIVTNYILIGGILLYAISAVFFLIALRIGELSVVYPLSSISYIFVTILSAIYLKEPITILKVCGIGCIILGVVLVTL